MFQIWKKEWKREENSTKNQENVTEFERIPQGVMEREGYRPYKYSSCPYKKVTSQTKLDSGLSVDHQLSSYRL